MHYNLPKSTYSLLFWHALYTFKVHKNFTNCQTDWILENGMHSKDTFHELVVYRIIHQYRSMIYAVWPGARGASPFRHWLYATIAALLPQQGPRWRNAEQQGRNKATCARAGAA
jgi:hypothetical protein